MKICIWRILLPNGAIANTALYFPVDEPPEYERGQAKALYPLLDTAIEEEEEEK